MSSTPKKIRVLVVDDSSLMRKAVSEALASDPEIEVVGTALDPFIAREKIISLKPDVLTLDIDMPRMDGITFLKILMEHHPMPVLILSSLTKEGSEKALEALQAGAVDVMPKPANNENRELGPIFVEKVKAASQVKVASHILKPLKSRMNPLPGVFHPKQVILMGASTGGLEALIEIIAHLPGEMPGICIVQHIPAEFSQAFARRLGTYSAGEVREAVEGDVLKPGLILVAPGDFHMLLDWRRDHYSVRLTKGPAIWHQRPSVDALFNSVVSSASDYTTAVILTGMGKDGAEGMRKLREKGAHTIAQNEESCAIFGMPRAAIEMGAASKIIALDDIPEMLLKISQLQLSNAKD
jgi:two-component system chemotaxis response regulator CheB